jgi:hypothetical protein
VFCRGCGFQGRPAPVRGKDQGHLAGGLVAVGCPLGRGVRSRGCGPGPSRQIPLNPLSCQDSHGHPCAYHQVDSACAPSPGHFPGRVFSEFRCEGGRPSPSRSVGIDVGGRRLGPVGGFVFSHSSSRWSLFMSMTAVPLFEVSRRAPRGVRHPTRVACGRGACSLMRRCSAALMSGVSPLVVG